MVHSGAWNNAIAVKKRDKEMAQEVNICYQGRKTWLQAHRAHKKSNMAMHNCMSDILIVTNLDLVKYRDHFFLFLSLDGYNSSLCWLGTRDINHVTMIKYSFNWVLLLLCFEMGSHTVETDLKHSWGWETSDMHAFSPPECWDCRYAPSYSFLYSLESRSPV